MKIVKGEIAARRFLEANRTRLVAFWFDRAVHIWSYQPAVIVQLLTHRGLRGLRRYVWRGPDGISRVRLYGRAAEDFQEEHAEGFMDAAFEGVTHTEWTDPPPPQNPEVLEKVMRHGPVFPEDAIGYGDVEALKKRIEKL